jgi:hypothetical protein
MPFIFPLALGGLALIGVPILIHLIMRQKPRTILFPAFRFLLQRHKTNLRKLRLRHLLLLMLRVLLIVGIFLALAQPLLFSTGGGLGRDHPVAVVFVIDTSPRMGYKASDGITTRLDVAREEAKKLLAELHPESKVLVLDSAAAPPASRKGLPKESAKVQNWAISLDQAGVRIADLRLQPSSRPLAEQIGHGLMRLRDLAEDDDPRLRTLPRFLCVFSDRTEGAWKLDGQRELARAIDQVPPTYEGLQAVQGDLPELIDLLKELPAKLPVSGSVPYPDQSLLDALGRLQTNLVSLTPDEVPAAVKKLEPVAVVLEQGRELLGMIEPPTAKEIKKEDDGFRDRLRKQMEKVMARLRGVHCLFFDVGLDEPADLALVRLETPTAPDGTPRNVFAEDEKWTLRAVVRASGTDQGAKVLCNLPGQTLEVTRDFRAGKETVVPFEIDNAKLKWEGGFVQMEVVFKTADALAFNNQRFLTIGSRPARRVLVIADDEKTPSYFLRALEALGLRAEWKTPEDALKLDFAYHAVYLFQVDQPGPLWPLLDAYVAKGGGLGVVPPRRAAEAYNSEAARALLPAQLVGESKRKDPFGKGSAWNLDDDTIFQHPMLRPFRDWRNNVRIDFIAEARYAFQHWQTELNPGGQVLVRYDMPDRPALLELPPDATKNRFGKVLLFTTPLDGKEPVWTNYLENVTSFYTVLTGLATSYLAGDLKDMKLNFDGGDPIWPLPAGKGFAGYALTGPGVRRDILPPDKDSQLRFPEARAPGNYKLDAIGGPGRERLGAFSVNLPPSEGSLARLPSAALESVFGPGSVLSIGPTSDMKDVLRGYRSEPLRLLPYLMLAILLLLACENLLGNLFYRKEGRAEETD